MPATVYPTGVFPVHQSGFRRIAVTAREVPRGPGGATAHRAQEGPRRLVRPPRDRARGSRPGSCQTESPPAPMVIGTGGHLCETFAAAAGQPWRFNSPTP